MTMTAGSTCCAPTSTSNGRRARAVFTEETTPQTDVKLGASGDVDDTLLEALGDDVKRQRKRLQAKMRRAVGLA